jgi:bacteriorhodopsin
LTTGALQTPLLLLDVLMLATVPIGTALWVVFADVLMILFGLFGAITSHHYRLGLWSCRVRLSLGQIYRFKPKDNRLEVYGDRFVGQHPL